MSEVDLQRTRAITDMEISGSTISRSAVKAFIATERSQADDTIATLTARLAEVEDAYTAKDSAMQRVLSERDSLRAEVERLRDGLSCIASVNAVDPWDPQCGKYAADLAVKILKETP